MKKFRITNIPTMAVVMVMTIPIALFGCDDANCWVAEMDLKGDSIIDLYIAGRDGDHVNVVAVGDGGVVYYRKNDVWKKKYCDILGMLTGVWAASTESILISGFDGVYSFDLDGYEECTKLFDCTPCFLRDVWGRSVDDVFSVGSLYNSDTEKHEPLVIHYDGVEWSRIPIDGPRYLTSVWGTQSRLFVSSVGSAESLYAGGILEYTGFDWSEMVVGHPYDLMAIHGSSSQNIYAVGSLGSVFHFNGADWREIESGTSATLTDVFVVRDDLVLAAAGFDGLLHFDGQKWSMSRIGGNRSISAVTLTREGELFTAGCVMHDDAFCEGQVFRNTCWNDGLR